MTPRHITLRAVFHSFAASVASVLFGWRLAVLAPAMADALTTPTPVDSLLRLTVETVMMAAGLGAGVWWAASYLLVAVALAAQARSAVGRAARNAVTRFGPRSARALLATAAGVTLTFGALPAGASELPADQTATQTTQSVSVQPILATPLTMLDRQQSVTDPTEEAHSNDAEITDVNLLFLTPPQDNVPSKDTASVLATTPVIAASSGSTTDPMTQVEATVATMTDGGHDTTTVTIAQGDTLWSLTRDALPEGATTTQIAEAWPRLYDANKDVLGDNPDLIPVGVTITIPQSLLD